MNKYFHNLVLGVSVLPALLVMPAVAERTFVDLDELYPDGTASSLIYEESTLANWVNAESITITQTDLEGIAVKASKNNSTTLEPSIINLGGEATNTITINTKGDGVSARKNGVVNLVANDTIAITTDRNNPSYDGGVGYGALWVQNNSENPEQSTSNATVNLTANQINLTAENASAIAAISNGRVNINGNATIKGKDAIYASGYSEIHINASGDKTVKMEGNIDFRQGPSSGTPVDATVDVTLSGPKSYWTGNTVLSYVSRPIDSKLQITKGATIRIKDGAKWNATAITENDSTSNGLYLANLNNLIIDNGTVNIADTTRGITVENATVKDATFNGLLNIKNMSLTGGENTFNGNVAGVDSDSVLSVNSGATMNIGKNKVDVDTIHLNGTLIADLVANADSILNANTTFDGNGKLSVAIEKAGTYNLFGGKKFDKAQEQVTSTVYDLDWSTNEGKTVIATVKSADKIAEKTGLANDSAQTISHIAKSDSALMQDLSLKIQEKLVENTPEAVAAVEHATKAINPETKSVAQSVSTSVQNTVVNLASARMASPSVGRNGGDVELTSGGVWAQGLFNKSKQADAFNGYTRGIAVGMDGTINKDWTIGAGYSFAHSDITGSARNTEIDSNTVFLYGQYKPTQWYVNAIANYTMSDFSERGTILDGIVVTGDYDVDSFGGALATGYDFDNGITPELGLRYMHVSANDYANSYGIKTHMDDSDFLTGVIGAKYAFNIAATKHLTLAPQLNAGIKYDLLSDKNIATVTMPGLNAYTLDGTRLKRIGGEFGIGLGMQYRELEVSVNYDIDVREDYTSQTGMLKFRYNF